MCDQSGTHRALARDQWRNTRAGLGDLSATRPPATVVIQRLALGAGLRTRASGGAGQSRLLTKTRAHPPTSGTKGAVECLGKVAPGCLDRRLWAQTTARGPSAWRNEAEEQARGRACGHCLSPVQSRGLWGGGWRLRLSGVGYPRVTTVREEAVFVKRTCGYPSPAHELGLP